MQLFSVIWALIVLGFLLVVAVPISVAIREAFDSVVKAVKEWIREVRSNR